MEIPVCSFIVHITSFKFLAIFLVAALSVSPGFSWFGYWLFPFFLGYGSQFPISSHSSWSLLGPGHHECYVVEFLDPAVFPLLVFNLAGLEPCPSCKYIFFSSWTLLLVCPSLSCWFFSKTPGVFPTQVWLSQFIKDLGGLQADLGARSLCGSLSSRIPPNILNSLLWHFKTTRLLLSATQTFMEHAPGKTPESSVWLAEIFQGWARWQCLPALVAPQCL